MADKESNTFHENSDAVQAHLGISQAVIQRMAANSASCKGWCIAITSAILVLVADKSKPDYALIAFIPILLFLALDAYYLALEKRIRNSYNSFIDKLHRKGIESTDLYAIIPSGSASKAIGTALISFSIWPFYLTLMVMALVAWKYIV
ncbi:MAG: hypothetical protein JW786_08925 [Desulfobacterales bacterium]|nr:hypothetical protein [Desulfobacterales bacterium]